MKKLLALTSAIILSVSCFAGCGTSQDDLNSSAKKICQAFNSALTEADEEGYYTGGTGYIASDGSHTFLEKDTEAYDFIMSYALDFYEDMSEFSYVVCFDEGVATQVYVADSMDSDKIGTYPEGLDVSGTLEDVKNNISENVEEPTTEEQTVENLKSDNSDTVEESETEEAITEESTEETKEKNAEVSKKTSSASKTFNFTADEFVEEYNFKVPLAFDSDAITLSRTENISESTETIKYHTYEMMDGTIKFQIECNADEYVQQIVILSNTTIGSFADTNDALFFLETILSPYVVFNECSSRMEILSLFNSMEESSTDLLEGSDGTANYSLYSSYCTRVAIYPI